MPLSPSLSSRLALFLRRPPYAAGGLVHGASAAKWTWGALQRHLARPLALSHAHKRPRRAPEPPRHPRHAQRRCPLRPLAVESPRANSTAPRRYSPHPGAPWPISTPRTPPSRGFSSFLLPPSAMAGEI